jgi:lysozyme family protein
MIPDVEAIISAILEREGGYVDHAADRGGPTNFGITIGALAEYRRQPVSAADVRDLTEAEARNIYTNNYLTRHQLHRIRDPYVLTLAFDCAVNHGPQRAIRWLQQIVGVVDDGVFGDATEIAVNSYEPVRLYQKLLARRIVFYGEIIAHDPERARAAAAGYRLQASFALGWARRCAEFVEV